ncbi:MAG: hypothetical protein HY302_06400 [Opitutae bacterium]|nr:hypothetical protein [Opitutae bacterium]
MNPIPRHPRAPAWSFLCLLGLVTSLGAAAPAPAADEALRARILSALTEGGTYAADVLLDEHGQARCDYNLTAGKWQPYEPAWHTGQIIYGLVEAYQITRQPKFLAQAKHAAEWWLSLQIKDGSNLHGMLRAVHGGGIDYIVFATVSDGTGGLFALWRLTGDDRYAAVPTQAGDWMLANMYEPTQRVFYDAVDPRTGAVQKITSPFWPEKKTQVLFDVARPNNEGSLYKDMFAYTKNEKYRSVFVDLCDSLVEKQGPEGLWMDFIPNNRAKGRFHPRFNLWYAESLIEGYELTGDQRYLAAARKTLLFYTKFQQRDGSFYRDNFLDGTSKENSVTGSTVSFAGLLWLRLTRHGAGAGFEAPLQRALQWVLANRFAATHPDPNLAGAFYNLRSAAKGAKLEVLQRDLGTAFGLRFLAAYYRANWPDGGKTAKPRRRRRRAATPGAGPTNGGAAPGN